MRKPWIAGGKQILDHSRGGSRCFESDALAASNHCLTIAAVGYRVRISRLTQKGLLNEELSPRIPAKLKRSLTAWPENKTVEKLRRTVLRAKDQHAAWFDAIKRHIRLALDRGAHFVVLPEFCLPPDVGKTASVANAIRKIASRFKQEFFIFSGSRHEGTYNRGFIVLREERTAAMIKNWWHYKMASARGLGENIMGPQNWKLPSLQFYDLAPEIQERAAFAEYA